MITVAVASYNHRPFVRQCIDSIVEQTYDDLELCWVDDCSTDSTFDEVLTVLRAPRVRDRFVSLEVKRNRTNRGAAFSLNQAARLGTAPMLSFMNSDDYYHPERLATMTRPYAGEHFWFGFSNVLPVDVANRPLVTDPTGERIAFDAERLVERFDTVSAALLSRQIASSTGNFILTRRLFDLIGGFVDFKYCHDWHFALQACLYCEPSFFSERLYHYRLHPTNSYKSLSHVAEAETRDVLTSFFSQLALSMPLNPHLPCPRRKPAKFWEVVRSTGVKEFAERVFFPYTKRSRMLDDP